MRGEGGIYVREKAARRAHDPIGGRQPRSGDAGLEAGKRALLAVPPFIYLMFYTKTSTFFFFTSSQVWAWTSIDQVFDFWVLRM